MFSGTLSKNLEQIKYKKYTQTTMNHYYSKTKEEKVHLKQKTFFFILRQNRIKKLRANKIQKIYSNHYESLLF